MGDVTPAPLSECTCAPGGPDDIRHDEGCPCRVSISPVLGRRRSLDLGMWVMHPTKPHLARLYCSGCEQYSRAVRIPTEAEKARAFPVPMYPDPPRGWEHGCPRCDAR